jgi:Ser/Thr protein kinase RdoA (MazF antagonist)
LTVRSDSLTSYHAAVTHDTQPPQTVLEQFDLDPATTEPLTGGLINLSFAARRRDGSDCVLQRVNAIFPPEIHDDIDAVTRHLQAKGLTTPMLLRAGDNRHHLVHDGAVWRLLTRVPGNTREALTTDSEASEAGRVLGSFHAALADFEQPLANKRPGVHDLARHLENLRRTLSANALHPARATVAPLAEQIYALAGAHGPLPPLPARLVHGDPKISNVIFDQGRGVCLVDLDTLTRMPVALELGDALRSWCNLAAEDSPAATFSTDRFEAALAGYRQGAAGLLTREEWQAVPQATLVIAIELAARFAADALNESYFAWDRQRFASASEHNRARAAAQLGLARTIEQALPALSASIVTNA